VRAFYDFEESRSCRISIHWKPIGAQSIALITACYLFQASFLLRFFFDAKHEDDVFFENVSLHSTDCTALYPKRKGRVVAQAVRRWLPTAAGRVRFRAACGLCRGQREAGTGFLRVLRLPCQSLYQFLHHHWWPQCRVDPIGLHPHYIN
jgi:hypothetical protein